MEKVDIYVFFKDNTYIITCDEWYLYHLINFKVYDKELLPSVLYYVEYICLSYKKKQCVHFIGQ